MNTEKTIKEITEAFLRWPLPESVCADLCATKPAKDRSGTNLLTYTEALAMFTEIVGPYLAAHAPKEQPASAAVREGDAKVTLTFKDFVFRASHHLPMRFGAASHPHWHTYSVRLWFSGSPDQDALSESLQARFKHLHGCYLNSLTLPESTDEALAEWFLNDLAAEKCVRVTVTNDGQRGAEATP